jgi:hypothetical protein
VECLPSKGEALPSNPRTTKRKKERKKIGNLENIIEKNSVEVFKGRFEKAEANLKIEHY